MPHAKYYFFLGNTPELSKLELESLLAGHTQEVVPGIVSFAGDFKLAEIAPRLGGIRKIAEQVAVVSSADLESKLIELMSAVPQKNLAVTSYLANPDQSPNLRALKQEIAQTRPVRFVSLDTTEHELVMLAHQHVAEFNLLPKHSEPGSEIIIAKTEYIFDAEDWIRRDRAKPYRDIKRGMLPPKVARIMVNLAARGRDVSVYDPFCGTGTILTEALLAGCRHVYGSDFNGRAVEGAKANVDWLTRQYGLAGVTTKLILADVAHPPTEIGQVDTIVTEPYMGPLLDERNPLPLPKIQDIARGLDKMYRGAFKAWLPLLPAGGRVVMTIPQFMVYGRTLPTISIDTLEALGYNYISSVAYGKPGVTVIRNITILEKK